MVIQTVRPKEIFSRAGAVGSALTLPMPQQGDLVTVLETCLLIAAGRSVDARTFFEFGTHLGRTALHLAMNSPDATVFTLDHCRPQMLRAYEDSPYRHQIMQIDADSREWRPRASFYRNVDLVFVDGGHDLETLVFDTHNALRMITEKGVIIWHDFGNPMYPDLTQYLERLSNFRRLIRTAETSLVFAFDAGKDA
jgi:predicted O-methyltransferase YrrM